MLELIAQGYFQNALIAGTLVGVTCSLVGVYVVLKRVVFLAIALAQIASAGLALALLLGWSPLLTALAASLGGAVAFSQIVGRSRAPIEGVLGASYVVAAALAIIFIAKNPVGEARALGVLFGNILSVPESELWALAVVSLVVTLVHLKFRKEFVFVSFDYETAAAQGLNARGWNLLLYLTLGVAIAFAIRSAGLLVTFALLVLPALGARLLATGMRAMFLTAVGLGTLAVPLGLTGAFTFDLPTGATISLAVTSLVALALAGRAVARASRRTAAAATLAAALAALLPSPLLAQAVDGDVSRELQALRESVAELRRIVTEQQRLIDALTRGQQGSSGAAAAPAPTAPGAIAPPLPAQAEPPRAPAADVPAAPERGLPPWLAYLPEIRLEGNMIGNYTLKNRRKLEQQLGEEQEGAELFVRRDRFNVREIELGLRSAVDPFARFEAILSAEQQFGGDLDVGLEEAIVTFGALPGKLELKVGKFRTAFGEFNDSDPEEIPEVDPPNVITNLFGPDGWIDTGLAANRLFGITDELSLMLWGAVFNGDNDQSFHGGRAGVARKPAFYGRLESFLELGDSTGLEGGVGYAYGHADDDDGRATLRSQILNAHMQVQYRQPLLGLYRGFNLLTEFFYTWRDHFREPTADEAEAGVPRQREVLDRWGLYTLADAQIARNWSLGGRFDYSQLPTREEAGPSVRHETAGSLILSYRPSRFLTLRSQYKHTERNFALSSDEIFLQLLFKLGYERPGPF
ncbi:MAG: metal ABC transporter permease [Candidatus Rokubacteria bacterium]|nr:metal ABC transporter permease [Candidatus Rokubacteria bacterium]